MNQARIEEGRQNLPGALANLDEALSRPVVNQSPRIDAEVEYISVFRHLHAESEARSHFRTAQAISGRVRSEMRQEENKLAWYASQNALCQEWVRFLIEMNRPDEALEAVESSRARLMLDRLGERHPAGPVAKLSAYRELACSKNTVLVSYALMPDRSYAWVIQPAGTHLCVLRGEQEIASLVTAYQELLEGVRDPLRTSSPIPQRLRAATLDPNPGVSRWSEECNSRAGRVAPRA